jgi:hypothetical protein
MLSPAARLSASVGTAADKTLYTYTLPASTLAAGKGLRVKAWFTHSTASASVTYKLFFGATAYVNSATTNSANVLYAEAEIFNNSGATNAQNGNNLTNLGAPPALNEFAPLTSAIDTTAAVTIQLTFNVAATDQVTGARFQVELIQWAS